MVPFFEQLLSTYGYWIVALGVMAESMGLPFPGETLLLLGGASAGAGYLEIWGVIGAAAGGALVGDTLGYELGRWGGRPLLERYGHILHLKARHLARAEAFVARYGTKAVFFGRFIAILRTYSAFLAGVYRLPYPRFLLFNAAGGILWALTFGWLGAAFGSQWPLIQHWAGRAGLLMLGLLVLVALAVLLGRWAIRHEARLRARGAALLAYPWVVALRTRLAPQLAFLLARLSPEGYLGLHLTVGVVVMVLGGWLFGAIAEDVVHQDPLGQVDRVVSHFLSAHTEPPFTAAMRVISLAGSTVLLVASLALAIALAWRQWWRDLILLVLAVGGGELVNLLLQLLFARPRPVWPHPLLMLTSASFPSAHAMRSVIFYGFLGYLAMFWIGSWRGRVWTVVAGGVLMLLIGFSRLSLGVHYLSDVLAGYASGIVWLALTMTGVEAVRRYRPPHVDSAATTTVTRASAPPTAEE
jgi:membrane protein DedA with SNARE-associated domain/membrane-associated phospholipid phosphatase